MIDPLRQFPVDADCFLATTAGVHRVRRGDRVLLVEPESAGWCVLDGVEWNVFERLDRAMRPLRESDVERDSGMTSGTFSDFVRRLYANNLISLDGKTFFEPSDLWDVQSYPHYFNVHVTDACNLACRYCRVSARAAAPLMKPETAKLIVRRIIEEVPSPAISIGFHGGEPMLNLPAIAAAVDEADACCARLKGSEREKSVKYLMQTNGTMLSAKTLATLKTLRIHVGISVDGPADVHDQRRVFRSGKGSYCAVDRGLAAADRAGIKVGYLAVIHEPDKYVDVLDHLVRERGARSVRINFSMPEGRAKDQLAFPDDRGEAFARGWLKMVDYAMEHHTRTGVWLDIADLNLFVYHLMSRERPHMCYRSPCGMGNAILGFGHDGRIYLCDEVVGIDAFCIGDVHDDTNLKWLLDNSPIRRNVMSARDVSRVAKCATCPWRRFHGSGCASKVFAQFGNIEKEDAMCRFYQIVFEELMWRLQQNPEMVHLAGRFAKRLDLTEEPADAGR
jgi:uncharacterized protein